MLTCFTRSLVLVRRVSRQESAKKAAVAQDVVQDAAQVTMVAAAAMEVWVTSGTDLAAQRPTAGRDTAEPSGVVVAVMHSGPWAMRWQAARREALPVLLVGQAHVHRRAEAG